MSENYTRNYTHGVDGSPATETTPILLNRYRVLEERARGGFGTVKICWDRRLQRRVAIKCMPLEDFQGQSQVASTLEEAIFEGRAVSQLDQTNIVRIYDFEQDGTTAYLIMEFIDGLTLEELLENVEDNRLTLDETAWVLDGLSKALACAHEHNILHLDIKPANIMIDQAGQIKLTDFGMSSIASATGYGDARGGTIGYMPPEQIEGGMVDDRTDLFALACVVWTCLAGKSPYLGKDVQVSLNKISRGPRPKLSKTIPQLQGPAELTILSALKADPDKRPAHVSDFAAALTGRLGNPQRGRQSLSYLVSQNPDETFQVDAALLDKQAPLEHIKNSGELFIRIASGFAVGAASFQLASATKMLTVSGCWGIGFLTAAAAGISATLGAGLGIGVVAWLMLSSCFAFQGSSLLVALILTAATLVIVIYWWVGLGRTRRGCCAGFFLPFTFNLPYMGLPYSVALLKPRDSALTTVASLLAFTNLQALMTRRLDYLADPFLWLNLALMVGIAAGGSALTQKTQQKSPFIAQGMALVALLGGRYLINWVKNGRNWYSPAVTSWVFAVILFGLMGTATVLLGSSNLSQEADR